MEDFNRGSEWRKWDLHIHTPASINQTYGNNDVGWEKFINALENLPVDIKVVGITDYYFIDGYQKVMTYKRQGRLSNLEKIFPILEFRIDTFGTASENSLQKINLHILFNLNENDLDREIEKVRNEFIRQIPVTKLPQHSTKMLSLENLTVEGQNDLQNGFSNLIPSTEKVFNLLESSTWKDNTFLFLGYKEWSNLEKNQQLRPFKEYLYSKVHAFFSNGYATNEKNQLWLNEYGDKRLLHSLDIHGFDLLDTYELDEVSGIRKPFVNYSCNTWIKSDPTFEGLKQIIFEPEQRVKIQTHKPDFKEDKLLIDEVQFISNDKKFTNKPIKFNPNLNVIIGGKSSGKSILLYNIARTLLADRKILKKDSATHEYRYDFGNDFDFVVKIKSGIRQSIKRDDFQPSILSEIKYIPQNYLSKLAEPENKKSSELLKLVRELLLEDDLYKIKYQEFLNSVKSNDNKRELIINNYFEILNRLALLKTDLSSKGQESVLNLNIQTNNEKITKLKEGEGLTEEQIIEYNIYNQELELIEIELNKIRTDYVKITSFNSEAINVISELIQKKNLMLDSLEYDSTKDLFKNQYAIIETAYSEINNFKELIKLDADRHFINENFIKDQFLLKGNRQIELQTKLKPFVANQQVKKEIQDLEKLIVDDKQKLSTINQIKIEIANNENALINEKNKLFDLFVETYNEYKKIIIELDNRASLLKVDNLQIIGIPKFNFTKFRNKVVEMSDGRSASYSNYSILKNELTALSDFQIESLLIELKSIFVSVIEKREYILNSRVDLKGAIKVIFDDYFFDYWEVIYDDDTLDKMSTGKASFVILMLIIGLSKSKAPILIDQPEDNLDNRSITKDLVKYLRNKKLERQVILVTHNPNVVVNADAENIIIANQKGQNNNSTSSQYRFDYINGPIENSKPININETDLLKSMGIREHIAEVVEGGKEAFKKREMKYGF